MSSSNSVENDRVTLSSCREHVSARNKGALQGNWWIDLDVFNANHSCLVVVASNGNSIRLPSRSVRSEDARRADVILRSARGQSVREIAGQIKPSPRVASWCDSLGSTMRRSVGPPRVSLMRAVRTRSRAALRSGFWLFIAHEI